MSEKKIIIVECSQGCRFPVNLNKHRDRDHVFCPKHKEKIKVRKKWFFEPNPDWEKQKAERQWDRTRMKGMEKPKKKEAALPVHVPMFTPFLARVMAKLRFKARKEAEERRAREVEE